MPDDTDPVAETVAADTALGATETALERPRRRPAAETELSPGDKAGRYEIIECVGAGGMGAVYKARDPELDRTVAIKVLHARAGGSGPRSELQARLLREARSMARLSHNHLVTVFDVGTVGERVFVAMELVEGTTLRTWLKTPRPWRETLRALVDAGRGLAAAHEAGVVHRDFKPDNVLISSKGRVQVADFGLSRSVGDAPEPSEDGADEGDVRLTRTGAIMGTPAYMAPEQHEGAETDARTDQFSFAVSVYEALYATRPFAGDTLEALGESVAGGRVREPPSETDVPRDIYDALVRAMSPKPADRWPSLESLLDELQLAAEPPQKQTARWVRFAPFVAALAVGATAVGISIAVRGGDSAVTPDAQPSTPDATPLDLPKTMDRNNEARDMIQKVTRAHRPEIRKCYEAELAQHPLLRGVVQIEFEIGPNGNVIATRLVATDFPELAIGSCIQSATALWKFPKPKGGGVIKTVYPFAFRQSIAELLEKIDDRTFETSASVRDYALHYPDAVVDGAKVMSVLGERQRAAAKIKEIPRASVLDVLGFEPGDTIERINGVRVTEPVDALVDAARGRSQIRVDYVRARQPRTLTIRVRPE